MTGPSTSESFEAGLLALGMQIGSSREQRNPRMAARVLAVATNQTFDQPLCQSPGSIDAMFPGRLVSSIHVSHGVAMIMAARSARH